MPTRRRASSPAHSNRRLVPALERWATFQLERAAGAVREEVERALQLYDLPLVRFAALSVVAGHGPLSPAVLAERLGIDRSTMARHLDCLDEEGLIDRRPHPFDGHRHLIALTPAGGETLSAVSETLERVEAGFLEPLDDHQRDDLRDLLHRLEPPERALGDLYYIAPVRRGQPDEL